MSTLTLKMTEVVVIIGINDGTDSNILVFTCFNCVINGTAMI
jgi:hypothetical protein